MKILIVEDSADCRMLLQTILRPFGKPTTAGNGGAGVERFKMDGPFDLVLTDFMMPVFNGDHVAKRIAEIDPNIPVVGYTGDPDIAIQSGAPFFEVFKKVDDQENLVQFVSDLSKKLGVQVGG